MGIDGIGRGGGNLPVSGVGPTSAPGAPTSVEGVAGPEATRAEGASGVSASSPLAQLQRGDITLEQYLDARVAEAVRPYVGRVPAEQLEFVEASLRESFASDPVLQELVRRTTGSVRSVTE